MAADNRCAAALGGKIATAAAAAAASDAVTTASCDRSFANARLAKTVVVIATVATTSPDAMTQRAAPVRRGDSATSASAAATAATTVAADVLSSPAAAISATAARPTAEAPAAQAGRTDGCERT